MTTPAHPRSRVLALFGQQADSLASEAKNAAVLVQNLDKLITREAAPDDAERQQLEECETAARMLRDRITARAEKLETLRGQRAEAETERKDLADQAAEAARVIEEARARTAAQQLPAAGGPLPGMQSAAPVASTFVDGQLDGQAPS